MEKWKKKQKKNAKKMQNFFGGSPPGPPEQAPPGADTPLEQAPFWADPWSRPPRSRHPPCEQNSWHMLMKILPCPKLHLWVVTRMHSSRMWTACSLTVSCSIQTGGGGVCQPPGCRPPRCRPPGCNPRMRTPLEAATSSRCRQTLLDADPPPCEQNDTQV